MNTYVWSIIMYTYLTICLSDKADTQDQARMAVSLGSDETFICPILENTLVRWTDVTTDVIIYTLNQEGEAVRHQQASDDKYNRYSAELASPNQFNLIITSVGISDVGVFICQEIFSGRNIIQYNVSVEGKVMSLTVNCQSPCDIIDGTIEIVENTECQCTCNGIGGYPDSLSLKWNKGSPGSQTKEITSSGPSGTYDFSRTVSYTTVRGYSPLECKVIGYTVQNITESSDIVEEVSFNILFSPNCTLELKEVEVAGSCTVTLTCLCNANPEVNRDGYSYLATGTSPIDSTSNSTTTNVAPGTTAEFSCGASNKFGTGKQSEPPTPYKCSGKTTLPTTTTTPNTEPGGDPTQCSAPALIAICCVEGVVIVAMTFVVVFLYTIKKGSGKEDAQSLETDTHGVTDETNSAYMDLQETQHLSSNNVNLDVPFQNLNLQTPFPGKGLMKYQKALMTLTSTKEKIVVKSVSEDAPVRLAILQADEVRKLATLTSNVNVTQFFGRCNNVPNLLCYQFVHGTNLGEYLRENFQPSKIHQYGNTKQKRYYVPGKGSVESLPKVALQIARGMKYLTTQKFLHPGLRSEKVIIDVSGQCKLYDFVSEDNAKDIIAILWSKSVPYQWMPPEYLFLEKLGPSVDVWSFGILMWEIFSYGALPHEGKGRYGVEKELRGKEKLPLPNNCPGAIWQIILNCWDQSPDKRPSFDHLSLQLSHMCNDNKEYDEIQSK